MLLTKIGSNSFQTCVPRVVRTQPFSPGTATLSIGGMSINDATFTYKTKLQKSRNVPFSSSASTPGPSLEVAKSMKTSFREMDNQNLVIMANIDSPPIIGAREEVLKRHIMRYDLASTRGQLMFLLS